MSIRRAHDLGSSGRSRRRRGGSRVKPSRCLPTEVARIEPAKRRESANGFVPNGLSGGKDHACVYGSRGGQVDERERGETSDPAVYTLLLLIMRPAIERNAEWGVGVTRPVVVGRGRTKPVDPFANGKVARGVSDMLSCTKGRRCWCVAFGGLGEVATGHQQTTNRICGEVDVARSSVFVFAPLVLCGLDAVRGSQAGRDHRRHIRTQGLEARIDRLVL